jgi:hypothetical protein
MSMGNSQQRTSVILYLGTGMLALPAMLSAFIPVWAALAVGAFLLILAITFTKREKRIKFETHF